MKRYTVRAVLFAALLCIVATASAADKGSPAKFKALEVRHFVLADGVVLPEATITPQSYLNLFYEALRTELEKKGIAAQIVAEGASVPEADAAESVVVEGKITDFKKAGRTMAHPAELSMQVDLCRVQGHALIKTIPLHTKLVPGSYKTDANLAKISGHWVAGEIEKALK